MKLAAAVLSCTVSTVAYAGQYHLLEPTDVSIAAFKYEDNYDPYEGSPLDHSIESGAEFTTNFNMFRLDQIAAYWDNLLHFEQSRTDGQIRHAGWEYELGLKWYGRDIDDSLLPFMPPRVELFRQHHSQHVLEETRSVHFPVYDRYGIRLRLYP